jgi:DNA ligase-1
LAFEFVEGSLHLPALGLWLDAHRPQRGPEQVFVSHAHSDHVAAHREVILSEPTARLMQARLPGKRLEKVLKFGESAELAHKGVVFNITLLPAGHIFGSAMALVEAGGQSLLYTGDFKLRGSLSAEACDPRQADVLVMETTFGRPQYYFPPRETVMKAVVRFCREALDNDETPVLLGYSLGKSQELLCGLGDAGLPIMLHDSIDQFTRIYQQFGHIFPPYRKFNPEQARGNVLMCPPHVANSAIIRGLGTVRTAVLTGWAVDPNCRFRYQCDAAFALSDHSDFPELVEFVERVQPKEVYTLHGFAADFARTLRDMGYSAHALSEQEQLTLALTGEIGRRALPKFKIKRAEPTPALHTGLPFFGDFAETCATIAGSSSKPEKTRVLSEYLRPLSGQDIGWVTTWFSGRALGSAASPTLQVGWAVLRDAFCALAPLSEAEFRQVYLKHSDLGETAAELLREQAASGLTLAEVGGTLEALSVARSPKTKAGVLARALSRCGALEGRYFVKIVTGDLRIGLKEGLVEEAVASAFGLDAERVRKAHLLVGEIGEISRLAAENRLGETQLRPFMPVKFMLASPEPAAPTIWERTQERQRTAQGSISAWVEDKFAGARCQLHKVGNRVELYSRDLKNVTHAFPELVNSVRALPRDFVLDGELIAMRGDEVLPFAALQKHFGGRENDLFMREEAPICYVAFDVLWCAGEELIEKPLKTRREVLESLELPPAVRLSSVGTARSVEEIEAALARARSRGSEGLVFKDPESDYRPGRRGLAWLKLKLAHVPRNPVPGGKS